MSRKPREKMEYRYYEMPLGSPILALLGEKWVLHYGREVDCPHFHNHLEIGYCYEGKGVLVLDEERPTFEGGMFSIIPKNIPHITNSEGESISAWEYLFIDADKFLQIFFQENLSMAERLLRRINRKAYLYKETEKPEIAASVHRIMEIMRQRKELYLEEVKGEVLTLLIQIARECKLDNEKMEKVPVNTEIISPALEFIGECSDQQIKIEYLAEICHISETHFRRVFYECMNMSPLEYLNWVRIKKACDALKRTNDHISIIAENAGFTTLSTFNRNFYRFMGISPKQWRENPEHYEQKILKYNIKVEKGW